MAKEGIKIKNYVAKRMTTNVSSAFKRVLYTFQPKKNSFSFGFLSDLHYLCIAN